MAVDQAAGRSLLRRSLDRYEELAKTAGHMSKDWEFKIQEAGRAIRGCKP